MRCTYTSKNGQLSFEFDASGPKELFLQRSIVELHDEEKCGVCGCTSIRCEVRKAGEYTYYEMRCQSQTCGARLDFGQNKDMISLFVKRSDHPDTNGWYVYHGNDREHDESPPQSPPRSAPSSGPKTPPPTRSAAPAAAPPADKTEVRTALQKLIKEGEALGITQAMMALELQKNGQAKFTIKEGTPVLRAMFDRAKKNPGRKDPFAIADPPGMDEDSIPF